LRGGRASPSGLVLGDIQTDLLQDDTHALDDDKVIVADPLELVINPPPLPPTKVEEAPRKMRSGDGDKERRAAGSSHLGPAANVKPA
jgi:hypothetical protein